MIIDSIMSDAIDSYIDTNSLGEATSLLIKKNVDIYMSARNLTHSLIFSIYDINEEESTNVTIVRDEDGGDITSVICTDGSGYLNKSTIVFNERTFFENENGYTYEDITFNSVFCIPTNNELSMDHYIISRNVNAGTDSEYQVNHYSPVNIQVQNPEFTYKLKVIPTEECEITNTEFVLVFDLVIPTV